MPDTVAGLFRSRSEADQALRKLEEAGFFRPDRVSVSTPRVARRGHYGTKVLAGFVIGALLGALVGAVASGMVPGVKPLLPGNILVTFFAAVAGAATGGVAGALLSMAASGDRALYYEQEVESGRVLITVAGPRLEEAEVVMREAGAMEAAPVEAPIEKGKPRPESG